MIITCKKNIPFHWILVAILPWTAYSYTWNAVHSIFLFSLRQFVENPAGITFVLSMPAFCSIIVDPCASFVSDRIWTRYGRRKPFIVTSWTGVIIGAVLIPLMPNFWSLLAVFLIYSFFTDLCSPLEPLKQEIIPPHERGRATGLMFWCKNIVNISFYLVALGRFDDVRYMAGVPLSGECVIYWSGAMMLSVMLLLILLGIKEVDQKSALRGQRLSLANFVGGLTDRELWPVYMLVFGSAALNAGLGPLGMLLYTDQWAYSKQDIGMNVTVGGVLNFFVIAFLTMFADKFNRMKAYRILICLSVALNFLYFCYVSYVLPDQRPSLVEIVLFGEVGSIIGFLTSMVYIPMVYDYIRRNKMGTYVSGANLMTKVINFVTLNGVGLFVWVYAVWFEPPAGEMTRVVWRGEPPGQVEVQNLLRASSWTYPSNGQKTSLSSIDVNAWQSNGTMSQTGRCWEVRLRDDDSEKIAGRKEKWENDRSPMLTREQLLLDKANILERRGDLAGGLRVRAQAVSLRQRIDALTRQIDESQNELQKRADKFQEQVSRVLAGRIIQEGDQVLGGEMQRAILLKLPVLQRPESKKLEKALGDLRSRNPALIDLRPYKIADDGYGIEVSAILKEKTNEETLRNELIRSVIAACNLRQKGLLATEATPLSSESGRALKLELMTIEEPLDSYISPVTRVVNAVLASFDAVPSPARKLEATARGLRTPGEINHVRINPGHSFKTISVVALLPDHYAVAGIPDDAITRKLAGLFREDKSGVVAQARIFYDRIEKAAAVQRITVARPVIATSYAPMKYNYMCAYIWMLILGLTGVVITLVFGHFETKGFIRKRGVEEAQAS
jgi:MFS family permease